MLAQTPDFIGKITPITGSGGSYITGLTSFVNMALVLVFLAFGLYALFTFILAAYYFMSAQGKQDNIDKARKMFTYTAIGLVLLASSFIVGGMIGKIFFNDWYFVLDPSTTISCTVAKQQAERLKACGNAAGTGAIATIESYQKNGKAAECKQVYESLRTKSCP